MALDNVFVSGLIDQHNDKDDKLSITNINLASGINISMRTTTNFKGGEELVFDEANGYMRFSEEVDNGNETALVTKYVSIDDISQITTSEYVKKKRVPGEIYPNYN